MKEKIIANKTIIMLIASIVAAALLVPSFITYFGLNLTANVIVNLVQAGLILATALALVFLLVYKKELTFQTMLIPVVLFASSQILNYVYNIIEFDNWASIYYLAIYTSILILYIISMVNQNKYLLYALYILLLVAIVIQLLGVFAGGMVATASFIMLVLFVINIYLLSNGKEKIEQWKNHH